MPLRSEGSNCRLKTQCLGSAVATNWIFSNVMKCVVWTKCFWGNKTLLQKTKTYLNGSLRLGSKHQNVPLPWAGRVQPGIPPQLWPTNRLQNLLESQAVCHCCVCLWEDLVPLCAFLYSVISAQAAMSERWNITIRGQDLSALVSGHWLRCCWQQSFSL